MNILLSSIALLITFYLIAKVCDEYFVKSLEIITEKLKISDDVAGATFMAIGSSAPELFVAIIALSQVGIESVGTGTIVGSAIFNILVIIGASVWVTKTFLEWRPVVRDIGFYVLSLLVLIFTFFDGIITTKEALIYLGLYIFYIVTLSRWKNWFPYKNQRKDKSLIEKKQEIESELEKELSILGIIDKGTNIIFSLTFPNLQKHPRLYPITFIISIIYIAAISWAMVELGVHIAQALHIPQAIIALTVLAAGTSVPDLISSVIASKKGYGNMAVSNAVGSNTFDILIGLGLPWLIYTLWHGKSVTVNNANLLSSVVLLLSTVLLFAFIVIGKKFELSRREGLILMITYGLYLIFAITLALKPDLIP